MKRPTLVLVSGAPGAGKTAIATELSARLPIPMVSKDALKESLFESLGWSDRAWSRKLGRASMTLLFDFVEGQLAAERSVIAESNFYPYPHTDWAQVRALQDRYDCRVFELHCTAEPEVLLERFRLRQRSAERHLGHVMETSDLSELDSRLTSGFFRPMDLEGGLLTVDTTDFDGVDHRAILTDVRAVLVR